MEWETIVILAQTVAVAMIVTVGIMWCFFEEAEKVKKD